MANPTKNPDRILFKLHAGTAAIPQPSTLKVTRNILGSDLNASWDTFNNR
jgi:hypothetical protein